MLTDIDASNLARLTPRESEVLRYMAKGFQSHEIAVLIGIQRHTVNDHIKAIYQRLDVGSRVEAAVIAAKAGWV